LNREEYDKLLDEYYEARGWDIKTGEPTPEKLTSLGLP
jgi:aldehyde:ferredoxin oxidoreductase